jgi:peroxiredoxin
MVKTTTGILLTLAVSLAMTPRALKSETVGQGCDANAKTANLTFTLKDINGKNVSLSSYKGKVILLDFWATWCPPCRKEIPGFIDLYKSYASRGLIVLGVSMDEEISDIKKFARQLGMNYPVLLGAGREDLEKAFGPLPLPTAFVIGRDGRICAKHNGFAPKEQFEREIQPLL